MRIDFKAFRNFICFVLTVEMLDDPHVEIILEIATIGIIKVLAVAIVYDPDRELKPILGRENTTFVAILFDSRREERSLPVLYNQDILNCES